MPPKRKSLSAADEAREPLAELEIAGFAQSKWQHKDAQEALYEVLLSLHDKRYFFKS
jgi:hypothetical protein